jgi:signal transduction histidine kinase
MMDWHFTPYAVPLFIGTGVLLAIGVIAWRQRSTRGAVWLVLLSIFTAIYTLGYAFELGSVRLADAEVWFRIEYIGITIAPVCLFALILSYVGLERFLTPLNLLILLLVPFMTLVFAWTNNRHELIWQHVALERVGDRYVAEFGTGPWYWINVGYIWLLLTWGVVLLVRAYRRVTGLFRRQVGIILAGTLLPFIAHVIYLSGLLPVKLDPSPYALTLVSLTLAWGIFNTQFLDIVPVARQTVLSSMSDAVIVVDARDRVVDLNEPAQKLVDPGVAGNYLGLPAVQVFPNWFATCVAPGDREKRVELSIALQGEKRVFDMQLTALHGRSGHYEGRLLVLHDMTRRKQAEEERERLLVELEAFAHTVAHDLKTPLAVLIGYSAMLHDEMGQLSPGEVAQAVAVIERTGQKMDNIIEELLLLASVRKMEEVPVGPLDMGAIVAEAQTRLDGLIAESGATVIGPEKWPAAIGYAAWVEEVWVNYLSNAIKYGGEPPRVELGAAEQAGGMVRFWVRDNGHGIPAEELPRLFVEFARLPPIRVEGHGLGLSIVRRIVEKLGGRIGVESNVGQGSEFSFTLPSG